jgi:hypothetical protein
MTRKDYHEVRVHKEHEHSQKERDSNRECNRPVHYV